MQIPLAFVIAEPSQVGAARRAAVALAASIGFSETRQGELALVVTEAANNLIRHARYGEMILRVIEVSGDVGIEVVAIDKGPGMASVAQCLQDGYSTSGTSGNGLGAIARTAHLFEVYSLPGGGTVLLAQFKAQPSPETGRHATIETGAVSRPKPGQDVCGDAWAIERAPGRSLIMLADGLGHGPDAAIASQEAVRAFRKSASLHAAQVIEALHNALRGTRGAAAAVAEIDHAQKEVRYAGIGNIAGTIITPERSQSMVSHNGIVGHQMRKVQEFSYLWTDDSLLVLHSDGLSGRWHLDKYPGIMSRHLSLIAAILYRDYQRDNDDATVVTARMSRWNGRI